LEINRSIWQIPNPLPGNQFHPKIIWNSDVMTTFGGLGKSEPGKFDRGN